jgi:transcription antitermination protein NusB
VSAAVGQSRRAARKAAVFFLYQHSVTGLPVDELRENARRAGEGLDAFGEELVAGVLSDLDALDAEIGAASKGWEVERIAPLERSILRVAAYEIRSRDDVPAAVAVNEAVEIAKRYCQADAAGFVNGILGTIARAHEDGDQAA